MAGPIEAMQVRRFGRSVLSVLYRTPVLVLETTGRRTGATRSTTLAYHRRDDGAVVVVGGAGGQARVADWVVNLRAHPAAAMTVDRVRSEVQAVELSGEERRAAWDELLDVWPQIDGYQRRAGRDVPVFVLTRL